MKLTSMLLGALALFLARFLIVSGLVFGHAAQADVDVAGSLGLEGDFLGAGGGRSPSGEQGCGQGRNGTSYTPGTRHS